MGPLINGTRTTEKKTTTTTTKNKKKKQYDTGTEAEIQIKGTK